VIPILWNSFFFDVTQDVAIFCELEIGDNNGGGNDKGRGGDRDTTT
jgi:hypothetical protein